MDVLWIALVFCCLCGAENTARMPTKDDFSEYSSFTLHYAGENDIMASVNYPVAKCTEISRDPHFNPDLPIVIYVHGFHTNQNATNLRELVESFVLHNKNYNVFTLDWDRFAYLEYFGYASPLARAYGKWVGQVLHKCSRRSDGSLDTSKMYLIGAFLGAHICGGIGKSIFQMSGTKISRITALDPAGPNFDGDCTNAINRLKEDDAEFVDVIHSDAGFYGMNATMGSADFWPNNGTRLQPGCPPTNVSISGTDINRCSHKRPGEFFIESVRNTNKAMDFYATKRHANGTMSSNELDVVQMGINCPSTARGNYYLTTDSKPPFSLGMNGIK